MARNEALRNINQNEAWNNFFNTGKIEDYLLYRNCKNECEEVIRKGIDDANKSDWIGSNGNKFRGK